MEKLVVKYCKFKVLRGIVNLKFVLSLERYLITSLVIYFLIINTDKNILLSILHQPRRTIFSRNWININKNLKFIQLIQMDHSFYIDQ